MSWQSNIPIWESDQGNMASLYGGSMGFNRLQGRDMTAPWQPGSLGGSLGGSFGSSYNLMSRGVQSLRERLGRVSSVSDSARNRVSSGGRDRGRELKRKRDGRGSGGGRSNEREQNKISFLAWKKKHEKKFGEELKKKKEELEKSEFFNERRQCHICKGPWYFNAYFYYLHLTKYPGHESYRENKQTINRLTLSFLEKRAEVAEAQRLSTLKSLKNFLEKSVKRRTRDDNIAKAIEKKTEQCRLQLKYYEKKSPEAAMFERFKGRHKCLVCNVISKTINEHDDHLCSLEHTDKVLEREKNEKESSEEKPQEIYDGAVMKQTEEIEKLIEEARANELDSPTSSKSITEYERGRVYGLEKIQLEKRFYCTLCRIYVAPGYMESHVQDIVHYTKLFEEIRDKEELQQDRDRRREQLARLREMKSVSKNSSKRDGDLDAMEIDDQGKSNGKSAELGRLDEVEDALDELRGQVDLEGDNDSEADELDGGDEKLPSEDFKRLKTSSSTHKPQAGKKVKSSKMSEDEDQDRPSEEEIAKALKIMEKVRALHNL